MARGPSRKVRKEELTIGQSVTVNIWSCGRTSPGTVVAIAPDVDHITVSCLSCGGRHGVGTDQLKLTTPQANAHRIARVEAVRARCHAQWKTRPPFTRPPFSRPPFNHPART